MKLSRTRLLAFCIGVALALPISPMAASLGRGGDTGNNVISPLNAAQLANLNVRDVVWDTNNTIGVAVGFNNTGGNVVYYIDATTEQWTLIRGAVPNVYYYGVDYIPGRYTFVIVGVNLGSPEIILWKYGGSWSTPGVGPTGSFAFNDVCAYDSNFVAVTNTGRAFVFRYLSGWTYAEIFGALPDTLMYFRSAFYDQTNYVIWMVGYDSSIWARSYSCYCTDLNTGWFYAYRGGPTSGESGYLSGDWSYTNGYGIIVGDERILKFNAVYSTPNWGRETIYDVSTPPGRYGSSMVWCSTQKVLLMFGGYNGTSGYLGDTWTYNIYQKKWTQVNNNPAIARLWHSMVYDSSRNRVVMYGGYLSGGAYSQETYEIDPSNLVAGWVLRIALSLPGKLYHSAMTFCSYDNKVYLYGGIGGGTATNMFTWDGTSWVNRAQTGVAPIIYGAAMIYDANSGYIIMFGGTGYESSTFTYNPNPIYNNMTLRVPILSPPGRSYHRMTAWSRMLNNPVIFGGQFSSVYRNDAWYYRYSSNTWVQINMPKMPDGRQYFGMAAANNNDNIYIFGGINATSTYTGTTYSIGRLLEHGTVDILNDPGISPQDVDWYPAGNEAIIAGVSGKIWRYTHATSSLASVENLVYPTANYYAVGCKAPASPGYALILGDPGKGLRLNDVAGSSPISINAVGPGISYVNFNNSLGNRLNSQVDVDSGTGSTTYKIEIGAGHSSGATFLTSADIYMWYDQGMTSFDRPFSMGSTFDTFTGSENIRMHFRWTRGVPDTWTRVYPATISPNEETSLITASCMRVDKTTLNTTLTFVFSPHQQVRATGSSFVQLPGMRYNGPGGQSTVAALDAANTWDFKAVVNASGVTAVAYDEFGFFKYTHLSSAGLPGALTGSGAPMSLVTMSPSGHVTFEANCPYKLVAYVDSNLIGQSTGWVITATNMRVQGGDWSARYFNGTGSANLLYALGTPTVFKTPASSGRTTSTSIGTLGGGGAGAYMQWYCYLPSVPQDTYTTTITYLLQN
jgi:hypothetical protein